MINKCFCGCGKLVIKKYSRGHNLKVNPRPQNLGSYIKGKKGVEHPNWHGGIKIVDNYKYIYNPFHRNATKQGYVCEHRLVMEKHIKRYLEKEEVVHHCNGNILDNRFENLVLAKNQAEHNIFHIRKRDKQGRFISGGVVQ